MKKLAIIGGGASGLMAAITAASSGISVDIFEQNSDVGKKILASGNGRCNIINTQYTSQDFAGLDTDFCHYALEQFNFKNFEKFALSIGLLLDKKEDGRCYPLSHEAKAVVLAFKTRCESLDVTIITNTKVTALDKSDTHFNVTTAEKKHTHYDKLLICNGSNAAPQLGGCEDGYHFGESFGHSINLTYPSLVQLHINSNFHHKMAGVRKDALVHLFINNTKEMSQQGDILFTKYGISGLAILDISERASNALAYFSEVKISINLFPELDKSQLNAQVKKLCDTLPEYPILTVLGGMIASKIALQVLEFCGIESHIKVKDLSPKVFKKMVHTLQDWRFEISDTHGFKHAEVSGGGINTAEINPKTMESTLCKDLYFAGEVVDIVGRRGGFNFAWAWASARLSAKSITS